MSETNWIQLFVSAVLGGLTVKLLDIGYQEYQARKAKSTKAEELVDLHLDPLLKSADELVGKVRALAEADFKPIHNANADEECLKNTEFGGLLYLFGCFFAQVEIIRRKGMSVTMSKDPRGAQLSKIFDCLESRRVRIIDRIQQRAIGEAFLNGNEQITYLDFVSSFEQDAGYRRWIIPISQLLSRTKHTTERQKLIRYITVIHALIDTIDPRHAVTRERPSMPNKLSKRSRNDLKYRVFGRYLDFVEKREKYLGPPKKKGGPVG